MTEQRQGEIALKMVKLIMRKKGVQLSTSTMREIGNVAKKIDVPIDELKEFARLRISEIVQETLT